MTFPPDRRTFMAVVSGGLLAVPLAAEGQLTGRIPRLCFLTFDSAMTPSNKLSSSRPSPVNFDPFFRYLRDLGYVDGKSIKSKVRQEGTFVVGGIVWRAEGWSLLVGSPEGNELRYRGLVHFGVGRKLANALIANGLVRSTSPFADKVPLKGVPWLDPRLTAEISYAEIMPGGKLRAGVFRGFTAV